jgi:hypothetical protein
MALSSLLPFSKKKADAVNTVSAGQLERACSDLAVEHNSSNTGDPLSTGPLSSVGDDSHVL